MPRGHSELGAFGHLANLGSYSRGMTQLSMARSVIIRPARNGERGATKPLADAFAEDPVMATFVSAGSDRRGRLEKLFWAMLRSGPLAARTVDVAVDENGSILGTAVWEEPRRGRERSRSFVGQIPAFLDALGLRGALAALRYRAVLQHPRPVLPHWYLAEIGVSPEARGLGVGSLLLTHRLGLVDAAREGAYLESSTERNRALYRRFGFVEFGTIQGLPSGRPMAMWRPAVAHAL